MKPDYSFVRDGMHLDDWLWKLFDESQSARLAAGEALQAMEWGLPSIHTEWEDFTEFPETEAQSQRFQTAVKQAFARPDFDVPGFVERLAAYRLALAKDWEDRASTASSLDEKYNRIADRIVQDINTAADDESKQRGLQQLARLSAVYVASGCQSTANPLDGAESISPAGLAAHRLFGLLDNELLTAPGALELYLAEPKLRPDALSALERIGPAAKAFAAQLQRDLDQLSESQDSWFDGAAALAAIGKNDPPIVEAMFERLCAPARRGSPRSSDGAASDGCKPLRSRGRNLQSIAPLAPAR